jgi:hydroxypyruvate reductase
LLQLVNRAKKGDLVITLVSGGGSSLLAAPIDPLKPQHLREMAQLLVDCGANIHEVNTVRQQIDRVKAGGLARACGKAKVAGMILSDVVGDPIELISSGPTVTTTATHEEALDILTRYDLFGKIPKPVLLLLQRSAPPQKPLKRVYNVLIANNDRAAQAAMRKADELGFVAKLHTTLLQGEAREVGRRIAIQWRNIVESDPPFHRPVMLLFGGETTVNLIGGGVGGRNHEVALAAVNELAGCADTAIVTLATDGDDGSSHAAGAVVTGETLADARARALDPDLYLTNNDSYTFFEGLQDSIAPGLTNTNVGDLLFCFHVPSHSTERMFRPVQNEPETIPISDFGI